MLMEYRICIAENTMFVYYLLLLTDNVIGIIVESAMVASFQLRTENNLLYLAFLAPSCYFVHSFFLHHFIPFRVNQDFCCNNIAGHWD